ncbi:MAG: hypothetical protein GX826_13590 [Gammaproteobacteria bacterium]|nr:hypothetical protein [Gammaproteobacteria bacterium]
MKARILISVLLLNIACTQAYASTALPDGDVLSACASAIYQDASANHTSDPDPENVFILPEGENSGRHTPPRYLQSQLRDADWGTISSALEHLHTRLDGNWKPPANIVIPGIPVRIKPPGKDWHLGRYNKFFISFWPPGYDHEHGTAFVLASFGPNPHGAMAACQLRNTGDVWQVEQRWVVSYL